MLFACALTVYIKDEFSTENGYHEYNAEYRVVRKILVFVEFKSFRLANGSVTSRKL